MKSSIFFSNYYLEIKSSIEGQYYDNVMMNLLDSFNEHFNTFNNNTSKYTQIWYQTLLDQFQLLILNNENDIESSLSKILDIHLELEIKSQEIKIDEKFIYKKTNI